MGDDLEGILKEEGVRSRSILLPFYSLFCLKTFTTMGVMSGAENRESQDGHGRRAPGSGWEWRWWG